jgi:RNA polymerase sigma factor (sigma-70 family)
MCQHTHDIERGRDVATPAGAAAPEHPSQASGERAASADRAREWAETLAGLLRGDVAARLRVSAVIGAYVRRFGGDTERFAADIVQDVMEALLRSGRSGALRDPAALLAYIGTITERTILDALARQARDERKRAALQSNAESRALPAPALAALDRVWIERALAALPAQTARVICEIYLAGRTYEETAQALGLTLRQVRRLRARGLERMREVLGAER